MKLRTDLATLALVALCVIAIAVLAALKVPIPASLDTIALVAAGGAAGIAIPQAAAAKVSSLTPTPADAQGGAPTSVAPISTPAIAPIPADLATIPPSVTMNAAGQPVVTYPPAAQ